MLEAQHTYFIYNTPPALIFCILSLYLGVCWNLEAYKKLKMKLKLQEVSIVFS